MNIPVMDELMSELETVTEADCRVSTAATPQVGMEQRVAFVTSTAACYMEALTFKLHGRAMEREMAAQFREADQIGREALRAEAARLKHLAKIAGAFFWFIVKDELGAWNHDTLGIRRDGPDKILVVVEQASTPGSMLLKFLESQGHQED
jgi:hypothetical protein